MYYQKLKTIFSNKQIYGFVRLIGVLVIGATLETFSVSIILPFMNILLGSQSTVANSKWNVLKQVLHINTQNRFLAVIALFIVFTYFMKGLYSYFQNRVIYTFIYSNWQKTSLKLFDCYINKPYIYHRQKNSADIIRSVTTDVNNLFTFLQNVMIFLSELLTTVFIIIFMLLLDPFIAITSCISLGSLLVVANKLISPMIIKQGIYNQDSCALMIKWCSQTMGGIKEIKAQKREKYFLYEYAKCSQNAADAQKNYYILLQIPKVLIESSSISIIFLIIAFLLFHKEDLVNKLPIFSAFAMAAIRIMPSINRLNSALNTMSYHKASLDIIYNDLLESNVDRNYEVFLQEKDKLDSYPKTTCLQEGIELHNVSFKFPDTDCYLFQNINLKIPAGKSVAFIGTTGAGKTTLADIILGLYNIQNGVITFDKNNLFDHINIWSKIVGYIPQFIYLCDDTIRNNVVFGVNGKDKDDKHIWDCLEEAHIKEFVENLPDGLDTVIGEQGIRLSGGQRQRIGIARALYNSPQFIVMDEATSALDHDTEQLIIETVNVLSQTKTLLIIAHRLSTIQGCDIIYRVEKEGITIEKGEDLL